MMEESPGKNTDLIFGGGLAPFVNYDLIKPNDILRLVISFVQLLVPYLFIIDCWLIT